MTTNIFDIPISSETKIRFAMEAARLQHLHDHAKDGFYKDKLFRDQRECMEVCKELGVTRLAVDIDLRTATEEPQYEFPRRPIYPRRMNP